MDKEQRIYDLIILGGGCAGLTAGIYAGRAKLRTAVMEKQQPGGQAATTDEIANYPGFKQITGPELAERMLDQARSFGTEFISSEVRKVDLSGDVKVIETSAGVYKSRAVILATGANPKKLGFEGEDEFRGRGVGYCATCDGFFFEGKDIFVIGGGYSAAEEALYLTRFGKKVTILVRKDKFRCAQSIVDKVMSHPKIEVRFHTEMVKAYGDSVLKGAILKNNKTGETTEYKVPEEDGTFGIFVFVGYQPSTELFAGQVELDQEGCVVTDDFMATKLPGVFAAGDLRPKSLRQLVTATADGAIAAVQAEKYVAEIKEKYGIKDEEKQQTGSEGSKGREEGRSVSGTAEEMNGAASGASSGGGSILTPELRRQVTEVFQKLERDVTFVSVVSDRVEKSLELGNFLEEVCKLNQHLKLEIYQQGENAEIEEKIHFERLPVVALLDDRGEYSGIKFCGVPGGHEFNSFVFAVYNLGGPGQAVEEDLLNRIQKVEKPVKLQVGVSLSCHFCPEVVIAAQRMAALNHRIEAEMVDIGLFAELKKQYNIMSVPVTIVNGGRQAFGPQSMENLLDLIEKDE